MIIDFHTHCFPDKIAAKAIAKLSRNSDTPSYTDGTVSGLLAGMKAAGIDMSVIMPVATSPAQVPTINRTAVEINLHTADTGICSFGGIHPDCENYRDILRHLSGAGIKGIKLHPVFQTYALDDIRFLRIVDCACENGLWVLSHAGYDISAPGVERASVKAIRHMLDAVHPNRLILAHMGGWGLWDQVEELLLDYPLWLDTSTCLMPMEHFTVDPAERKFSPTQELLPQEQFIRMVKHLGADRVLMASDSPWTRQDISVAMIRESGLCAQEIEMILGKNAEKILFS